MDEDWSLPNYLKYFVKSKNSAASKSLKLINCVRNHAFFSKGNTASLACDAKFEDWLRLKQFKKKLNKSLQCVLKLIALIKTFQTTETLL